MDIEQKIRQAVNALEKEEVDVLYWHYDHRMPEADLERRTAIGKRFGKSAGWVWNKLQVIKGKFRVVGIDDIDSPEVRTTIAKVVNEAKEGKVVYNPETTPVAEESTPPQRPFRGRVLSNWRVILPAILLALLVLFGAWRALITWLGGNPFDPSNTPPTTEVAVAEDTSTPTLAPTPMPTDLPTPDATQTQAVEETSLAFSAAETATASVTETPTSTPTQTDTPTITPTLTETLTPTVTFTPTPLFSDNFDSGILAIWTPDNGEWILEEGEPGNFQLKCIRPGIIYLPSGTNWTNYVVSADIKIISGSSAGGLVVRRSTPVDWYDAMIIPEEARIDQNYRVSSLRDDWREIQGAGYPIAHGTWYNVRLEVVGIQLTMYVNDTQIVQINHERHSSGTVGLRCGPGTIAVFDNVTVESK